MSPSKTHADICSEARDVGNALNPDGMVTAARGRLVELESGEVSLQPDAFWRRARKLLIRNDTACRRIRTPSSVANSRCDRCTLSALKHVLRST